MPDPGSFAALYDEASMKPEARAIYCASAEVPERMDIAASMARIAEHIAIKLGRMGDRPAAKKA
jgi:hypothetical protein